MAIWKQSIVNGVLRAEWDSAGNAGQGEYREYGPGNTIRYTRQWTESERNQYTADLMNDTRGVNKATLEAQINQGIADQITDNQAIQAQIDAITATPLASIAALNAAVKFLAQKQLAANKRLVALARVVGEATDDITVT
jgi:hypothetical protein